MLIVYTLMLLK